MAFYKSNHPAVMTAASEYGEATRSLIDAGKVFAAEFDGVAKYRRDPMGASFGGLAFTPQRDRMIWTVPDRHGIQAPRSKPRPGASESHRIEHKGLRERWAAQYPRLEVRVDGIYAAIGTSWGEVVFCGCGFFERNGWLYVETTVPLNDRMVEILGSEHAAAKKASET